MNLNSQSHRHPAKSPRRAQRAADAADYRIAKRDRRRRRGRFVPQRDRNDLRSIGRAAGALERHAGQLAAGPAADRRPTMPTASEIVYADLASSPFVDVRRRDATSPLTAAGAAGAVHLRECRTAEPLVELFGRHRAVHAGWRPDDAARMNLGAVRYQPSQARVRRRRSSGNWSAIRTGPPAGAVWRRLRRDSTSMLRPRCSANALSFSRSTRCCWCGRSSSNKTTRMQDLSEEDSLGQEGKEEAGRPAAAAAKAAATTGRGTQADGRPGRSPPAGKRTRHDQGRARKAGLAVASR